MTFLRSLFAYGRLKQKGVLSMNARNIRYISRYNNRKLYPLVDNKLSTKKMAIQEKVNVPNLIGVIAAQHDVRCVSKIVEGHNGFCIKPAKGSGGKGILVITSQMSCNTSEGLNRELTFQRTNGEILQSHDVERHVSNILAGLFSLGGASDVAVIESLIEVDDRLVRFTFEGVPDLRVIVFQGFPVMAMMRLSCRASNGKANLHQGAIGVGIDIASGQAVQAVQFDENIVLHPDTGQALTELEIPDWENLLVLASRCYDMCGLGYLGVDLVLDKQHGPLLLELNARPGLSIQLANASGLVPRLSQVEHITDKAIHKDAPSRVAFARNAFSAN